VCGDFFGGTGVEAAWQSARALTDAVMRGVEIASAPPDALLVDRQLQRAAA
jgi:hypothetical protein